jgi:hypothetical protein
MHDYYWPWKIGKRHKFMILVDGVYTTCMLREDLVDDDVNLLHVGRSLSMMCNRFNVYCCYRFDLWVVLSSDNSL